MSDDSLPREDLEARLASAEAELDGLRTLVRAAGHSPTALALDAIAEGLLILDRNWRVTFVNPAAERLVQRSSAELLGGILWEMFPEARSRRFGREYLRAVAENVPVDFEEFYPEPLNAWYHVRAYPSSEGLSILFSDIAERTQAEAALRASDQRLRAMLQTAMNGFWLVDLQGRLLEVNEAYCRMSGYTEQELLTMRIPDVEAVETSDETAAHIQTLMAQGEDRFESRHRRKDGGTFDVEVSVQYLPIEGGRFVVYLRDVSDRKQAERLIERARTDAEREKTRLEAVALALAGTQAALRDANVELLVANEALRINNQTLEARVAARTADLAHRTYQLESLARDLARAEERERQRIAQVIHDQLQQLLSVARIKLGMAASEVSARSTRQSVAEVDDLIAESLEITRTLTAELSPGILHRSGLAAALRWLGRSYENQFDLTITVEAEEEVDLEEEVRTTIFRSVRELLFNVVKHARVTSVRVKLELGAHGGVRVLVSDDGVGFDPEAVRAREGTDGSFGLFSLRERLELLGGRLEVDSAPGRGARFTILAPPAPRLRLEHESAPAEASAAPAAGAGRKRTGGTRMPARRKKR